MTPKQLLNIERLLRSRGVTLRCGLDERQLLQVERRYGVRFPPDFAELLTRFVPASNRFYDWSDSSKKNQAIIRAALEWPSKSIMFDVEHNCFWLQDWGERPTQIQEALRVAKDRLAEIPALIPICAHRYLPSEPCDAGNPILSVWQTDIIYYGSDLYEYFSIEFGEKSWKDMQFDGIKRDIPFWGRLLE
jgi:hypothetical protein